MLTDHMFLVPERALSMDITRLQEDLAGLDFDPRVLQVAPMGNVWISGSRPSSAARGGTMHWFAYVGPDPPLLEEEDREIRLRNLKDRQNEERQKKLDEIKTQAYAAQRYKEQKEQERKLRFEELRQREDSRRHQVEERKRAINEAERDRLESILRRNQEREARIDARKRNDRHSMVFAFGSSTPRMLEPVESYGTFWGHRRATSTQNITCTPAPLTRRQSERELDGGSKKRATSAGGLERSVEDALRMSSSMYEIFGQGGSASGQTTPNQIPNLNLMIRSSSANFGTPPSTPAGCISGYVGRRRTDLMPTMPSKDSSPSSARNKAFARSPGRAYSMSRLDQLSKPRKRSSDLPSVAEISATSPSRPLHHSQPSSVSRSMSHLAVSKLGTPQRPLRKSDSRSMHQLSAGSPMPPPRTTRATHLRQQKLASAHCASTQNEGPSRPSSALSQQSTTSVTSSVNMRMRPIAAPRRPRPASIAVTGVTSLGQDKTDKTTKPPLPKSRKSSLVKSQTIDKPKKKVITSPTVETKPLLPTATVSTTTTTTTATAPASVEVVGVEKPASGVAEVNIEVAPAKTTEEKKSKAEVVTIELVDVEVKPEQEVPTANLLIDFEPAINEEPIEVQLQPAIVAETMKTIEEISANNNEEDDKLEGDMTASMMKVRITTEEEAKAALAERRRLAREEAERQAEMERLRIEEENRLEFERQQREEDQQRVLIEQMRVAEQSRLEEAIKEAQKREEEERLRREVENRQKVLKEEADRQAKEEAERQKAELAERLKHEEKEREVRRKRVEAIMLRTRGKNNPHQTDEKNEEDTEKEMNGSKTESENGHKNGKELVDVDSVVDNIIPVETLKNANTVNVDTLSTDDTLNSNNSWQHNNQQSDLLM